MGYISLLIYLLTYLLTYYQRDREVIYMHVSSAYLSQLIRCRLSLVNKHCFNATASQSLKINEYAIVFCLTAA